VNQTLKKHESTTSIIDRLNPTKDSNDKQVSQISPQYSTSNRDNQPLQKNMLSYGHDMFVLHAPPRSIDNISSYQNVQEMAAQPASSPEHSDQYPQQREVAEVKAHENGPVMMTECDSQTNHYMETPTSPPVEFPGYSRSFLCHNSNMFSVESANNLSDDSSSAIFNAKIQRATDYHSFCQQSNCIVLNFGPSSSLANSNEVIFFEYPPKNEETLCEEITEHNFYIDPSHFNPL